MNLDAWLDIQPAKKLYTIKEASRILTKKFGKEIKEHNISYLVQYGRVNKYKIKNRVYVDIDEVENYYKKLFFEKRKEWEEKLGFKLDWDLAFDLLSEKERTKHVHGIHPYKGKFIPQLVEYFLKRHFNVGDIIIDPFMGSGTTLVQCMEMGINSIGIDISPFNCLIAEVKLQKYDIQKLKKILLDMLNKTKEFSKNLGDDEFVKEMDKLIEKYNKKYFTLEYKRKLSKKEIDEDSYSEKIMEMFYLEYKKLKEKYCKNDDEFDDIFKDKPFLYKWYSPRIRAELNFYLNLIKDCRDETIKKVAMIILSRTARSVRGTTHFDLATLKEPVFDPYYCYKHKKICRPVQTILRHLEEYTNDVISRIEEFSKIRKDAYYLIINGDSRTVDIEEELKKHPNFYELYKNKKIDGIFTSPPYLGQIDYHEQHAYAYELFDIPRLDELEIGPKFKGSSKKAQKEYIEGISDVLINMKRFLNEDAKIFIVVNDKKNLYKEIFEKSGLILVREFKRPVLNRTERDRNPYYESIFELKMEE
ncbi:modification methylase, type II R/M system [Methanocaldococcus jannaschii DSM 2661]|uniref:Type II methyltransferase M.MjaII n=1 Tax=Methanocaldococcus jannaschii (strain ATCC 43067 / DSM 2661 / JAL-1 / JCM 10045 / NBRC 100440) TaxID=243232 RepID=MTM2_METJA|nr:DNA methyltransferase [Methanocaldococcus jannaschii]Q58843.1 RecName: Full=Type II methyltransferase M.MjaII; Short=M.MjaII; AltName: Full=N-4 cytosine-specific methyltransferase MjaII [Methanocaldococcus jannaschii DSM 2661]AAB99457.1 modification methylase, type II R/M system [Methanocaldococcus jannaschii DSM 2661]